MRQLERQRKVGNPREDWHAHDAQDVYADAQLVVPTVSKRARRPGITRRREHERARRRAHQLGNGSGLRFAFLKGTLAEFGASEVL